MQEDLWELLSLDVEEEESSVTFNKLLNSFPGLGTAYNLIGDSSSVIVHLGEKMIGITQPVTPAPM